METKMRQEDMDTAIRADFDNTADLCFCGIRAQFCPNIQFLPNNAILCLHICQFYMQAYKHTYENMSHKNEWHSDKKIPPLACKWQAHANGGSDME